MGTMASQSTSRTIFCSAVYSRADQRKHQSSASLVFVWGIHRWPVNSPHKGPVTRKMFHLMPSSCCLDVKLTTVRYICGGFFVGQMLNECSLVTIIYLSRIITWASFQQVWEKVTYMPYSLVRIWTKKMNVNEGGHFNIKMQHYQYRNYTINIKRSRGGLSLLWKCLYLDIMSWSVSQMLGPFSIYGWPRPRPMRERRYTCNVFSH